MFAVVFEVNPKAEQWDAYLGHAATLRPELQAIEGFIANERYRSQTRPGWLVSLSLWENEKALIRWRTHALHHEIQGKGRSAVFADYHLRVGEVVRDTAHAGTLPQQRFDATETGPAKVLTLTAITEMSLPEATPGPIDSDSFESITRPGSMLYLRSWPDLPSAEAAIDGLPGAHRIVRVIRDYSMRAREEAPQYFPPI